MLRGLGGDAKCKRAPDPGTHQNIGKKLEANGRGLFLRDCCTTCNQRLPFLGADMECAGAPAPGTHKIIRRNLGGPTVCGLLSPRLVRKMQSMVRPDDPSVNPGPPASCLRTPGHMRSVERRWGGGNVWGILSPRLLLQLQSMIRPDVPSAIPAPLPRVCTCRKTTASRPGTSNRAHDPRARASNARLAPLPCARTTRATATPAKTLGLGQRWKTSENRENCPENCCKPFENC